MASVNRVTILGNVGKEPDIRTMQNGNKVASFSVATAERWKDKNSGERKEKTEWHKVVVFNESLISIVERFLKKGSKVYIEGSLETRKWTDQSGSDRYNTEIVLKAFKGEIVLLDSKAESDETPLMDDAHAQAKGNGYQPQAIDLDSDIPF